jgi:hypothetical protein
MHVLASARPSHSLWSVPKEAGSDRATQDYVSYPKSELVALDQRLLVLRIRALLLSCSVKISNTLHER